MTSAFFNVVVSISIRLNSYGNEVCHQAVVCCPYWSFASSFFHRQPVLMHSFIEFVSPSQNGLSIHNFDGFSMDPNFDCLDHNLFRDVLGHQNHSGEFCTFGLTLFASATCNFLSEHWNVTVPFDQMLLAYDILCPLSDATLIPWGIHYPIYDWAEAFKSKPIGGQIKQDQEWTTRCLNDNGGQGYQKPRKSQLVASVVLHWQTSSFGGGPDGPQEVSKSG